MQASSLLMPLAYLQNKSVQHIQAALSPAGKGCQRSLWEEGPQHMNIKEFSLLCRWTVMVQLPLLESRLAFKTECCRKIDKHKKYSTTWP